MAYALLAFAASGLLLAMRVYRVRRARFVRLRELEAKFKHLVNDLDAMDYKEAAEIMKLSHSWDLPWTTTLSLTFALFKTYAIPSISTVLCKTSELSTVQLAGRRAEDTATAVGELLYGDIDKERGSIALARVNWLHSRYGSLITQDDLKYTLSLFVSEPFDMNEQFEWRSFTHLEKQARFVFWREVGARMGITNLPQTLAELRAWSNSYSEKKSIYAPSNEQVGDATFAVLLDPVPSFLKRFAKQAALTLIDDHTRTAFGWQRPPRLLSLVVPKLLALKGIVSGYLLFPRITPPGFLQTTEKINEKGHHVVTRKGFLFQPWYVVAGCSAIGEFGYGKPGQGFHEEGFVSEQLGPERLRHQGVDVTVSRASEMRGQAAKCPFFM